MSLETALFNLDGMRKKDEKYRDRARKRTRDKERKGVCVEEREI